MGNGCLCGFLFGYFTADSLLERGRGLHAIFNDFYPAHYVDAGAI
jgi:hypothetical protein